MRKVLLIVFLLLGSGLMAYPLEIEDKSKRKKLKLNNRSKRPAGLNLYAGGPVGLAGVSFDYFVTPKVSLELGAGARTFDSDLGFFGGGRYHFFGKTPVNITPFIGLFSGFEYTGSDIRNYNLYIPVGVQRIKKNGFTWTIEAAYMRSSYEPLRKFHAGFKLGYRF